MISCPQGCAPITTTRKKTKHCAAFDRAHCSDCPRNAICPAKPGKKAFYLRFTDKQLRIALRRSAVETDEFKDRYRWRAGVEATMSEYDRRTGVKHLRVRGFKAVRFSAILKALAVNIFRAAAVMAAILAGPSTRSRAKRSFTTGIEVSRERFWALLSVLAQILGNAGALGLMLKKQFCTENLFLEIDFLRLHQSSICFGW